MKSKWLSPSVLAVLIFVIASIGYLWPFLRHPAFNLIDDGQSLLVSHQVVAGDWSQVIELENGRVRPLYWLYFVPLYSSWGVNPLGFWLSQALVLAATLVLVWLIITTSSVSLEDARYTNIWLLPLILSLLIVPAVAANVFRLGTAELRQGIMLLGFLWWMSSWYQEGRQLWLGWLLFIAALLTKETSILLVPVIGIFSVPFVLSDWRKYQYMICTVVGLGIVGLLYTKVIMLLLATAQYAQNFQLTWAHLKLSILSSRLAFNDLYYLISIAAGSTIWRVGWSWWQQRTPLRIWKEQSLLPALMTAIAASLFFVFSWEYQLERYFYLTYLFVFLYIGLEVILLQQWWRAQTTVVARAGWALTLIVCAVGAALITQRTRPQFLNYPQQVTAIQRRWFGDYQHSYTLISRLMTQEDLTQIFVASQDYEIIYEIGLYSTQFELSEATSIYSLNQQLSNKSPVFGYQENIVSAFTSSSSADAILISQDTTPLDLADDGYERHVLNNDLLEQYSDRPLWQIWSKKP